MGRLGEIASSLRPGRHQLNPAVERAPRRPSRWNRSAQRVPTPAMRSRAPDAGIVASAALLRMRRDTKHHQEYWISAPIGRRIICSLGRLIGEHNCRRSLIARSRIDFWARTPRATSSRLPARACMRSDLSFFFFSPARLMLLIWSGGRPLRSAISRSCSIRWPRAALSSSSSPPSSEVGTRRVRALRPVLVNDVVKGEFAFGVGSGFLWHARL